MKFKLLASSLLMAGAFALSGAVSVANANSLSIVDGPAFGLPNSLYQEAIGDPGGSALYPTTPGQVPGAGLPTVLGGWPTPAPGFAPDSSYPPGVGGAVGISGYDGSYLKLDQAGDVTFQFLGKGDAANHDIFQLYIGNAWATIFDNRSSPTTGVSGTPPQYTGYSVTHFLAAGLIPFQFVNLDAGFTVGNVGSTGKATDPNDNPNIHDNPDKAHFFLGVDPYLAKDKFDTSGTAVFAGLTDLGFVAAGDHDYEDLVVRISVPEPGILALLMAGLLGFGVLRRRQAVSTSNAIGLLA